MPAASELEAALLNALPIELHAQIPWLAHLLRGATAGQLTPDELQRRLSVEPALAPVLAALGGRSFAVGDTTITFSGGDQRGANILTGNIAGRDMVVVQTGGGDYATGDVDTRQGQFFEGGIHIHYSGHSGAASADTLRPPEPARPPEVADFIGREAELGYFAEKLTATHMAVISGMAGVGKTTLAAALARQIAVPDKIFWHTFHEGEGIDAIIWKLAGFLAWHGQDDLWKMLDRTRHAGGQLPPPELLFDYLTQAVVSRGYILCLDDFQFVEDDPLLDQLVRRLRGRVTAGELDLILTARRMPAFAQIVEFAPLTGLSIGDTRRLLEARRLAMDEALATELCTRTEGNAQLLTLAIDALGRTPNQARLVSQLSEADDIERYLMAELDAGLTDAERAIMSAVAVLLGYPGTRDAIETIADTTNTRRTLGDLSGRYLLIAAEGELGREYRQHAIVQAFYYNLLGQRERQALHLRAGNYYETEESDALKAARHFQHAGEHTRAAHLATADVWTAINQGNAQVLRLLLEEFSAERLEPNLRVAVIMARGEIYTLLGQNKLAQESYRKALGHLTAQPDSPVVREHKARAYRGMAELLEYESPREALVWLHQGKAELAGGAVREEGILCLREGSVLLSLGEYDAALSALDQSLHLLPEDLGQQRAEALMNLGIIWCIQGELERGRSYFLQALEIYQQTHDLWGMTVIWQNLSRLDEIAGDWIAAVAGYQKALDLAERLGHVMRQTELRLNLGNLHVKQGDFEAALTLLSQSLELAYNHQFRATVVLIQSSIADLRIQLDQWDAAESALNEAEQLAFDLDTKDQLPEIYRGRTQVKLARGNLREALDDARRTVSIARELDDPLAEGMSLRVQGQALLAGDQHIEALEAFAQSLALLDSRDPFEAARTKMRWGIGLIAADQAEQGKALLEEARTTFLELGAEHDLAAVEAILYANS